MPVEYISESAPAPDSFICLHEHIAVMGVKSYIVDMHQCIIKTFH